MRIRSVEDGEIAERNLVLVVHVEDARSHMASLLVVGVVPVDLDALPFAVGGPNRFRDLVRVVGDDRVRRLHDGLGRAVVLLELVQREVGVVVLEVEDVLDVRAAEAVDGLGVVADHADVFPLGCQLLDDQILGKIRVLVLVHHQVLELRLVLI